MKNTLFTLLMIYSVNFYGQSTDLDPFTFNYSYIQLPSKPILDKKNRTYSFVVSGDKSLFYDKSRFFIQTQVTISGFEKKEKNGYLNIEVTLQNPVVTKNDITTRAAITKDKNGIQTTKYYYTPIVTYSQKGNAKVISIDGKSNKTIHFNDTKSEKGAEFEDYLQAQNFQYAIRNTIINSYLNDVIKLLNSTLNEDYGYIIKTGENAFWVLANKKHPEQEAEYNAYLQVKKVFDKMSFSDPVAPFEAELEEQINYFKSLPNKYPENSKGDRKIRYSAFYNLAQIYYYLDQPAKSNEWANTLIFNDYDSRDGKTILATNNNDSVLFHVNQLQTRHFAIDTKNFIFDEDATPQQSESYSIESDPNYILAYIATIAQDTIAGYILKNSGLTLSDNFNLNVKDLQGKFSVRNFKANEVNKLTLSNGEEFATVTFKAPVTYIGVEALAGGSRKFVKEIFAGKKIAIYQYFNGEIIIKGANDQEGKSNASASWMLGAKKNFAILAQGCTLLIERVEKKEFKNNLESILSFATALEACK